MKGGTTAFALSTKTKLVAGIAAAVLAVSMSTAAMQTEDAWAAGAGTAVSTTTTVGINANAPFVVDTTNNDFVPANGANADLAANAVWYMGGTGSDYGWEQAGSSWIYNVDKYTATKAIDANAAVVTASGATQNATTTIAPVTGFVEIEVNGTDNVYYFNSAGIMQTGWQNITITNANPEDSGKAWYYFEADGAMVKAKWVLYNGEWYYMYGSNDTYGAYSDGLTTVGTPTTACPNTVTARLGQMNMQSAVQIGAAASGNIPYFFNTANGAMARNYMLTEVNTKVPQYWICDDGAILDQPGIWIQTDGKWYLSDPAGPADSPVAISVATTTTYVAKTVGNKTYYFNKMGVMQTGWINTGTASDPVWHHTDATGAAQTNAWVEYAGQWFWMGNDTVMATSQWVDGGQYYVGKDGAWVPTENNAAAADDSIVSNNPYNI